MGTPEFAVPSLVSLNQNFSVQSVWTQPDRPKGRGLKVFPTPVKEKALELGIPVHAPKKLSEPENFEKIKKDEPDVIVVVAYGKIIQQNILDLPRLGCVNVHSSLLPRWRGAAPIQRAILEGDPETGVTTMRLVPELDAGDILLQSPVRISEEDTGQSVHDRLSRIGADLVVKTLNGLEAGEIEPKVQDEKLVTYAEKLTKQMELLDPKRELSALKDKFEPSIRGLEPPLSSNRAKELKSKKSKPCLTVKSPWVKFIPKKVIY